MKIDKIHILLTWIIKIELIITQKILHTECDMMKIQVHLLVLRLRKFNTKSYFSLHAAAHICHVLF